MNLTLLDFWNRYSNMGCVFWPFPRLYRASTANPSAVLARYWHKHGLPPERLRKVTWLEVVHRYWRGTRHRYHSGTEICTGSVLALLRSRLLADTWSRDWSCTIPKFPSWEVDLVDLLFGNPMIVVTIQFGETVLHYSRQRLLAINSGPNHIRRLLLGSSRVTPRWRFFSNRLAFWFPCFAAPVHILVYSAHSDGGSLVYTFTRVITFHL